MLVVMMTCCFGISSFSQDAEIKPLKMKKLRKEIARKSSPFYYPELFRRYVGLDTTLSTEAFRYLYYGYPFQDDYAPYGRPSLQDSLVQYLAREDPGAAEYGFAAKIAGELLKESPFRLRETFIAAVAYEMAGNEDMSSRYFDFFEKQVSTIMSTGDGRSQESAFVVIHVGDEYQILEVLGFQFSGGQALLKGGYDRLEVATNPYGVEALYFDVKLLLEKGP